MKSPFLLPLLFAFSPTLPAQRSPQLDDLLNRLVAYAAHYSATLPSLECEEDFVSQQLKGDKVKWQVAVTGTLKQVRDSKDSRQFKDSYVFQTVNGRPAPKHFKMPYFVEGAFANGLGFGGEGGRDCYEYRLSQELSQDDGGATIRLEYWAKPDLPPAECKDVYAGYRKIVLIDTAAGHIRHITRSMSADAALKNREVDFASIDYAPQQLGDAVFWLPVRVEAHNARNDRRMIATFSNYHRYAGEVRIVPEVSEPGAAPPHVPQ